MVESCGNSTRGGGWRWSDVNGTRLLLDTETVKGGSLVSIRVEWVEI